MRSPFRRLSTKSAFTLALVSCGSWLVPSPASAQIGEAYVLDAPEDLPTEASADDAAITDREGEASERATQIESLGRPAIYFVTLWRERREAKRDKDEETAAKKLEEMIEAKKRAGWPDFFVYGRVLSRESAAALEADDPTRAVELAEAAVALAPDAPSSYMAIAKARWRAGEYGAAALGVVAAVAVSWSEPPLWRSHFGNFLLAVTIGLLLTCIAFALISIFRYARLAFHDMRHAMLRGAATWQAAVVGIAVLAAPVLFRLGVAWTIVAWVTCMGMYYRPRERIGAIFVLCVLAAIPVFLPHLTRYWVYAGSSSQAIYAAARSLTAEDVAEQMRYKDNPSADESYVLGLRAHWSGDPRGAAKYLEAASASGANDADLFALQGNVHFDLRDYQAAIAAYERALRTDPKYVVALFNMSRVYFAMGEHQKGNAAYRRATVVDFETAEAYAKQAKAAGRGYVVPVSAAYRLLSLGVEPDNTHLRAVDQIWRWLGAGTPRLLFSAAAILAIIIMAVMAVAQRLLKLAGKCERCGMAACRRCNPELPGLSQCGQCYHAFVTKDGVEPQLRIQKEIASHRYQASLVRLTRLFSLMMAGAGQLTRGATLRGMVFMTVCGTSVTALLAAADVIPTPATATDATLDTLVIVTTAMVAVSTYAIALWDGARDL